MAKLERSFSEGFDALLSRIDDAVKGGSFTATLEEMSDFREGNCRCSIRVYERYSWTGGNRVSMSVTLFQGPSGRVHLSATTSGGSQAAFLKFNTFGEESFLDTLRDIL